ncbi:MAG TPA: ABC transporter ATP-binding protein [Burkholderiales bacterium]|nr:ABC transporter ATP-binding protein [Burkholderiales bacterium]
MTAALECRGVWKSYASRRIGLKTLLLGQRAARTSRYARRWALQDVSFEVSRGQAFGVLGANGMGKTTLLSVLLGIVQPERGSVSLRGRVASLLELGAGFHPELSGRDNLFLYGSILGMRRREVAERLRAIVEFSELGDAVEEPLRTYSAGMITRLGFSLMAHAPADVFLIDEVLAVGDARFQEKCRAHLLEFKRRNGTLVIVSHDMEALAALCDEGIRLDMGQVADAGRIGELIGRYQTQ